ncbi:glycerophosphodiester phosphodiesterase [Shewanella sp. JM162201]|uniref:glycerophosphodiester phosphodiesterase n=1 Tax=Shewanella jiangmenensis TaxID=2837387 RepID=A0ABS5UZW3_9GAMM|nr:glycerophosphodiester phosphodiesterase family protein [Shewanella jiangmenensis]MBT1443725.1 glycerophosphodiester phosphodiesterase [Shewanella jiangmenensis]
MLTRSSFPSAAALLLMLPIALLSGCNDSNDKPTEEAVTPKPPVAKASAEVGVRPAHLISQMSDGPVKSKLQSCAGMRFYRSDFSIGHRGAAMQFPEHTRESYQAAIDSGAGVVECDVTFTADKELVCRHSQCDLHTTTNILAVPELAAKCSKPFTPYDAATGTPASAECCTSDISLEEFMSLKGKMDGANPKATTVNEYLAGTPSWRTELYSATGTLMTHAQSIEMFKAAGVKMTPELKAPSVAMPFDGMSQQDYADKLVAEYQAAGVSAENVYPQSFNLEDVKHWIASAPEFGKQAVYLDERDTTLPGFDPMNAASWQPTMAELKASGVQIIAPPLWMLVTVGGDGKIVPSTYATEARAAGLDIITWTLERSGHLSAGGGWYYQSIKDVTSNEGVVYELLDVLAKDIGVIGVFSDWPATVTYYANCNGL